MCLHARTPAPPCPARLGCWPAGVVGPAHLLVTSQVSVWMSFSPKILSSSPLPCRPPSPLARLPASPEGPWEPAWPWTRCLRILSSCQPASVFTGPPSFLGSLVGVRLLAFSGPEPSGGLVSGARGFRCVRVSCSHGSEARRLLCATPLLAGPACVWHCSFQAEPPTSLCWDARAPRRVRRLLKRLLAALPVPATPHPGCKPPSTLCQPPRDSCGDTLVSACGFPSTRCLPARRPSASVPGTRYPLHARMDGLSSILLLPREGLCHTSCVSVGREVYVGFCGVSNSISGGVNIKHC